MAVKEGGAGRADANVVRRGLDRLNHRPRRQWGQNFLTDLNIAGKIVAAAQLDRGRPVLEIGPGLGVLTDLLLAGGADVTAVEIDRQLAGRLAGRAGRRLRVINADILKMDIADITGGECFQVVANLPYYLTTPILFKLIEQPGCQTFTLMVQREVAERLVAGPGIKAYGVLSVAVQRQFGLEVVMTVPPGAFYPRPTVWSAVVRGERLSVPRAVGTKLFRQVVRAAFGQRRKTMANALAAAGMGRERVAAVLAAAGLPPDVRGERLTVEQFGDFCRLWGKDEDCE
ncbi:MAG: 16S rRNA (adenine(1518)-N(6)/adenine(1519)-N(6))-dimethyltransferase RsmA [Negativicutes bacterium]|nr:16S rRNA (adenine(1518)-N(6)/adenine(1519)-N(6))-dimethyltransferase RsmA [Negativicutes bacterium]